MDKLDEKHHGKIYIDLFWELKLGHAPKGTIEL